MAKRTRTGSAGTAERKPRAAKAPTTLVEAAMSLEPRPLDRNAIASRAYELFLADGGGHGRDVEHWLRAERELIERPTSAA